jgi:hypothetical protein
MFLKKALLLGSALTMLGFSAVTQADNGLVTHNNTSHDSAVRLNSGFFAGKCTGTMPAPLPSQYTPAGQTSTVGWTIVGMLCKNSPGNICKAEIHMTRDCSDAAVATTDLNLNSKTIQNVVNAPQSGYSVSAQGAVVSLNVA